MAKTTPPRAAPTHIRVSTKAGRYQARRVGFDTELDRFADRLRRDDGGRVADGFVGRPMSQDGAKAGVGYAPMRV